MWRDVSLNSLKLYKETAKSKLSGESNWLCLANFVSYKFYSLNCSAAAIYPSMRILFNAKQCWCIGGGEGAKLLLADLHTSHIALPMC